MTPELFEAHAAVEDRHWWFTGRRAILKAVLNQIAPPGTGLALADIGCGTGGNLAGLVEGYRGIGIDPSPDAIRLASSRFPALDFVVGDDPAAVKGHLAGGGIVLLTDVLEHIDADARFLERVIQMLPRDGQVLLTVPADPRLWSGHDIAFGHFRRYTPQSLAALWTHLPVIASRVLPFNAKLYPIVKAVRALRRRAERPCNDLAMPTAMVNGILHRMFASEAPLLANAVAHDRPAFKRGVSLLAVLRVVR